MKIAVCGKGGVGKTFIAGTLATIFRETGNRVLAIDADTSPNLGLTLGLTPGEAEEIVPLSENEQLIRDKTDTGYPGVYRLTFSVDDIIRDYAVPTPSGVTLVVMGTVRTAGGGCACPAHTMIRSVLSHLVTLKDEVVIMDMEAGIEHLGRGTAEHVDIFLIVSDAHLASLVTAGRIAGLMRQSGMKKMMLIGNKVADEEMADRIQRFAEEHQIRIGALIPFDHGVMESGISGHIPAGIPSPAPLALKEFASDLEKENRRSS